MAAPPRPVLQEDSQDFCAEMQRRQGVSECIAERLADALVDLLRPTDMWRVAARRELPKVGELLPVFVHNSASNVERCTYMQLCSSGHVWFGSRDAMQARHHTPWL